MRGEPSDELIATLITPAMIDALTGYGQGDLPARTALVKIIKAIPVGPYLTIAQNHGFTPDLARQVAEHAERIRELEQRFEGGV